MALNSLALCRLVDWDLWPTVLRDLDQMYSIANLHRKCKRKNKATQQCLKMPLPICRKLLGIFSERRICLFRSILTLSNSKILQISWSSFLTQSKEKTPYTAQNIVTCLYCQNFLNRNCLKISLRLHWLLIIASKQWWAHQTKTTKISVHCWCSVSSWLSSIFCLMSVKRVEPTVLVAKSMRMDSSVCILIEILIVMLHMKTLTKPSEQSQIKSLQIWNYKKLSFWYSKDLMPYKILQLKDWANLLADLMMIIDATYV